MKRPRPGRSLRSEFDLMLLNNAREKGVEILEGTRAVETVERQGAVAGVRAMDRQGLKHEFRAPLTLDASGREVFSMTRNRWKVRDPKLNKIAIWTYYQGARRDPGLDEGATTVAYLPRKGWFWYIPLPEDRVSVGIVAEKDYLYRTRLGIRMPSFGGRSGIIPGFGITWPPAGKWAATG